MAGHGAGPGLPTLALEFDHPEQAGQRAVQRVEIGEWLGDVDGWKQQLAAWAEQIAELNQQQAGDTDTSGAPAAAPTAASCHRAEWHGLRGSHFYS
jgi:putative protein-disulfide isomerase